MQFSTTILAALFMTSAVFATAIPEVADETTAVAGAETDSLEGGASPGFDPLELSGAPTVDEQKRDLDDFEEEEESVIEKRSAASNIVACAAKLKGTRYLYGGCKASKPFGPAKNGLDCTCLSKTCVYKGTKTVLPRTAAEQYKSKVGKCHQIARSSAKAGDLIFWGCGTSGGVHHVAIYSNKKNYVWHAPHTGDHVREAKIWTSDHICPKAVRCW